MNYQSKVTEVHWQCYNVQNHISSINLWGGLWERDDRRSAGLVEAGVVSNWAELLGGCDPVSGAITGWGSGNTGVAVSKDGTPDSAVLEWELFCKISTCRLQTRPSSRWTLQKCDEGCCAAISGCHLCPDKWSCARAVSPTAISLNLTSLSWCIFILPFCWQETWVARSGLTRERRVRSSLCRNSLAGGVPVVARWVLLCDKRKFWTRCCRVHDGSDAEESRECLKVCTNGSARLFDDGWYGETSILWMPFCLKNSSYWADWNGGPLSLTICFGKPYLAKVLPIALAVSSAVVVVMGPTTSGHFEQESTMIR